MLIEIDQSNYPKIKEILKKESINYKAFDNIYWTICREEIIQSIDNCSLFEEKSFYDIFADQADDIIYQLTYTLYNSKAAENNFGELTEITYCLVHDELKKKLD